MCVCVSERPPAGGTATSPDRLRRVHRPTRTSGVPATMLPPVGWKPVRTSQVVSPWKIISCKCSLWLYTRAVADKECYRNGGRELATHHSSLLCTGAPQRSLTSVLPDAEESSEGPKRLVDRQPIVQLSRRSAQGVARRSAGGMFINGPHQLQG